MSIFDAEERRIIEQEREEAELQASIERDKELDEAKQRIVNINELLNNGATKFDMEVEDDERDLIGTLIEALELLKVKYENIINGKVKELILPNGFYLHQIVYMKPTDFNGLNEITAYKILSFSMTNIGPRADLSIIKKITGTEPFYCASFDMFNKSIFATFEEASQGEVV